MSVSGQDILRGLRAFPGRVGFLYLVLFGAFILMPGHQTMLRMERLRALSRATPAFDYGREVLGLGKPPSFAALEDCRYYHRQVAGIIASSSGDAWGIAGFCAYGLGREDEAIRFLERSEDTNQVFFWTHYNLGVAWMNKGDYRKAGDEFLKAIRLDPKYTLMLLGSSKVYKDILYSMQDPYDPEGSLKQGYVAAQMFLKMSMACFQASQSPACRERDPLKMRMF